MIRRIMPSALVAATLLLSATLSFADETKPATATDTKAVGGAKTTQKSAKAPKAVVKVKLVDINSASKAQLKKLPGIGDAEADQIIAGRPYLTKAHLLTQNIMSRGAYEQIHSLVIAEPNQATAAKLKEMQKGH